MLVSSFYYHGPFPYHSEISSWHYFQLFSQFGCQHLCLCVPMRASSLPFFVCENPGVLAVLSWKCILCSSYCRKLRWYPRMYTPNFCLTARPCEVGWVKREWLAQLPLNVMHRRRFSKWSPRHWLFSMCEILFQSIDILTQFFCSSPLSWKFLSSLGN